MPPSLEKFEYQPLDAERNELRLVYFTSSCIPESSDRNTETIVCVEMKTVSLDDYSEDTREWMKGNNKTEYLFTDYLTTVGANGIEIWVTLHNPCPARNAILKRRFYSK